jgi:hypothetical protein
VEVQWNHADVVVKDYSLIYREDMIAPVPLKGHHEVAAFMSALKWNPVSGVKLVKHVKGLTIIGFIEATKRSVSRKTNARQELILPNSCRNQSLM